MRELGPFSLGEIPAPIVVTFNDADGQPLNLTGFDARWVYRVRDEAEQSKTADITDEPAGEVTYSWVGEDLDEEGKFFAQMWVGNGTVRFASELFTFQVEKHLTAPSI